MPKHAKPINNNKRKSSNSKHGSTLCQWCFKKIAKGMYYCNNKCRERSDNYRKASQSIKKEEVNEIRELRTTDVIQVLSISSGYRTFGD
jgi:predicted amidophosphoribosyltransferase